MLPDTGPAGTDDAAATAAAAAGLHRPVLGVVGRLSPEKGVDVFLDACALLQADGFSFSALVAGDGPEREALLARAERLDLGARVRFLGAINNVSALYREIDLLVIPSHTEGLPNVLLEAIGADRPVLTTAVGAVADVLTDPLTGVIVPPQDPAAMAKAIPAAVELRHAPASREARAATAVAFSLDRRVQRHLELYGELVPFRLTQQQPSTPSPVPVGDRYSA